MTVEEKHRLIVESELTTWYVTPAWVAKYYDKPAVYVHRAIADGRLKAVRVRGRWLGTGRDSYLLDIRQLPPRWPKAVMRNGQESS